ncbi:MAG: DUF3179 domain-containing protein [SAR324 cluster bacterium]|nr:DUF3179 domain-containing protein [SAR324 cluster bacterium]
MKHPWTIWAAASLALLVVPALLYSQGFDASRTWRYEWPKTDFSKHSVDFKEILSGGPPKDGIPPVDNPKFVAVREAESWLQEQEPVLVFEHGGEVRAYPLQILIWHEIVNDTVGGKAIVVTFCPLCNSALVFDRRVNDQLLDFGTTGKLRHSDLVMWDRQTESWWQQITGEAIVGELTGTKLTYLPSPLVSFETFRASFPDGRVLSRDTGFQKNYGANPYVGYDDPANTQPFLLRQRADSRLRAMERVVVLELGDEAKAYPYTLLDKVGVVNDRVGGVDLVVFFKKGTRSALDGPSIARSRDVGTGVVFERSLDGRSLNFDRRDGLLVDRETGTRWNLFGQAVAGKLKGERLKPVVYGNHFAFAWLAFRPDSKIYAAP